MSLTPEDKMWLSRMFYEAVKAILYGVEDIALNKVYSAREHATKFEEHCYKGKP